VRLSDFFRLVRGLARQLPEGRTPRFLARVDAVALAASERAASHLTLETAADDVVLALVDEVAEQVADGRVVVLADAVRDPDADDVARWFLLALRELLAGRVARAVVVRAADGAPLDYGVPVERARLEPFTTAEVAELLEGAAPAIVDAVFGWSGGYPIAVAAAAPAAVDAVDADALRRLLERPPPALAATVARVVDELAGDDPSRRALIEVAGVLRRFDEGIVLALLADLRVAPPDDVDAVWPAVSVTVLAPPAALRPALGGARWTACGWSTMPSASTPSRPSPPGAGR
jgi:hypothetical protein